MGLPMAESLREGNRFEAKLAKGGVPASMWETYSAFANTEGGTIVLGASEKPSGQVELVGVDDPESLVKKIWDAVNNPSKVSANVLASGDVRIADMDGCRVVVIDVPRASRQLRPVYVGKQREKGTFRRNGEGDYHCSSEEIVAMVRDASPAPLDAAVLEEFSLEALSQETVVRFRASVEAVRPHHPWLSLSFEELLVRLNAAGRVNGEGPLHPTRAGLLMFGFEYEIVREYPEFFLDYRQVGEGTRWDDRMTSQDGAWSGNVFDFWLQCLPRLVAGIKRPFALGESLQRIEDTDMHAAARELFVNALVHADYYGRRGVVALRFHDRIEVANPGTSRVALDAMVAGGVSDARNPTMMKMFSLINACERAGSGFDVMRSAARTSGARPPEAKELLNPDRIVVSLFLGDAAVDDFATKEGRTGYREGADSFRNSADSLPEISSVSEEGRILERANGQGFVTRKDVEQLLGCGPTKAKGLIGGLVKRGVLKPEGSARSTRYRIVG
uniref:Schlafen AlbA-2 domain-containing protein n=1 Tax=Muribaculaceae bacterium Z82 TaxID=2304548 RepID=A0A7C9JDF0_9BACT